MKQVILGSQSPRRKQILGYFSLPFETISPDFDENSIPFRDDPEAYVCALAAGKAHSLKHNHPDAVIITADSVVHHDHKVYGKPKDEEEAFQFLTELSGRWHSVFTGIAVVQKDKIYTKSEETLVLFNEVNEAEIRSYHKNMHWKDKAGGYGIQMAGGLLVHKIDGCYYNVMGFPINTVRHLLQKVGIELWDYMK